MLLVMTMLLLCLALPCHDFEYFIPLIFACFFLVLKNQYCRFENLLLEQQWNKISHKLVSEFYYHVIMVSMGTLKPDIHAVLARF